MAANKTPKTDDPFAPLQAALDAVDAQVDALDFTLLGAEERAHSNGRLREGEEKAQAAVLDAVDLQPGLFGSLAAQDGGVDDTVVETGPSRAALARAATLKPLVAQAERLLARLSDELLHQVSVAKDLTIPAYAILKVNVAHDAKLAKVAKPATTFYGQGPKKAAMTKAKKKASKP
jgi:predicted pyridoxine 5'-phosphate oxidase superfamily flavin-nucleotide-binding protein